MMINGSSSRATQTAPDPVSSVEPQEITEPDGFRVVATVAQGKAGTPVRLEAVLAPDQSVVLSTPRAGSVAPNAIEISRQGDQVLVHQAAVTNY